MKNLTIISIVERANEKTGIKLGDLFEEVAMTLNEKFHTYNVSDSVEHGVCMFSKNFKYIYKGNNVTIRVK